MLPGCSTRPSFQHSHRYVPGMAWACGNGVAWSPSNAISKLLAGLRTHPAPHESCRPLSRRGRAIEQCDCCTERGIGGALRGNGGRARRWRQRWRPSLSVTTANTADSSTWNDITSSPVNNGQGTSFNAGGFDISSLAADPHDETGDDSLCDGDGLCRQRSQCAHLYRSIDGGAHWTNISSNLPNAPANSVVVDPNDANTLYVATGYRVYVATQVTTCYMANCWSIYGTGLPNAPIVELAAAAGYRRATGARESCARRPTVADLWQIPLLTASAAAQASISLSPTSLTFGRRRSLRPVRQRP